MGYPLDEPLPTESPKTGWSPSASKDRLLSKAYSHDGLLQPLKAYSQDGLLQDGRSENNYSQLAAPKKGYPQDGLLQNGLFREGCY